MVAPTQRSSTRIICNPPHDQGHIPSNSNKSPARLSNNHTHHRNPRSQHQSIDKTAPSSGSQRRSPTLTHLGHKRLRCRIRESPPTSESDVCMWFGMVEPTRVLFDARVLHSDCREGLAKVVCDEASEGMTSDEAQQSTRHRLEIYRKPKNWFLWHAEA